MVTGSSPHRRPSPYGVGRATPAPWAARDSISRARMTTDEFEIWFEKGVTDGLPVVPPTRSRVARMLAGTRRGPDELIGEMAPNYGRLTVDVGGSGRGETWMSPFGHPGRYTYSIAENEEASPWPPYHVSRGVAPETSAVTLFAGEAPHGISDHASRTAKALAGSLGWSMVGIWNSKHFPLYSHTMLIVGPEHARTFADDGWTRERLARHLHETVRVPYRTLVPDDDHGEGTNLRYGKTPPALDELIPKFPSPDEIHVVVAGGTAGRVSAAIPGWLGTKNGSRPVTRPVEFD